MVFLQQTVFGRIKSGVLGIPESVASLVVGVQDLGIPEKSTQTVCSIGIGSPLVDTSIRPVSLFREWSPGVGLGNYSRELINAYLSFMDRALDSGQIINTPWGSSGMPVSSERDAVNLCLSHITYHRGDFGDSEEWKPLRGEIGLEKDNFINMWDVVHASDRLALLYNSLRSFGVNKKMYQTLIELVLASENFRTDNMSQEDQREVFLSLAQIKRSSEGSHRDTYKFFQSVLMKFRRRGAIA